MKIEIYVCDLFKHVLILFLVHLQHITEILHAKTRCKTTEAVDNKVLYIISEYLVFKYFNTHMFYHCSTVQYHLPNLCDVP